MLAALLSLLVFCPTEAGAARRSAYFRLLVSPRRVVYAVIWKGQLRFASAPDEIARAAPVTPSRVQTYEYRRGVTAHRFTFPETILPVPRRHLPDGWDRVVVSLTYVVLRDRRGRTVHGDFGHVHGQIALCREDEAGAEWSYWCWVGTEAGGRPDSAPALAIPKATSLSVTVTAAKPKGWSVPIGVGIMSGELMIIDIKRNGKSTPVTLRISDSSGKAVATQTGDLVKFGFT
jgi:hypothetical protein